ncbi:uncharacterized protein LOC126575332 [Anopheles aquasalis]|uniref:uncharacterized protein LOC126575332 n=1 Tax=Anopheles aquasalis TaxID=42839 RepID=UPI00215B404D|nr:uncharacterized protein LOC126575332 [Anopheles aquasalis]
MKIRRRTNRSAGVSVFHLLLVTMAALVRQSGAEDCGQEELVQCTKPLQLLSATSELSFVTKKEELDQLCPDLDAGLQCIRSFARRCMNIHQRAHFNKLYHGTSEVIHELCEEGTYQEDFLRHAPCMRHVKKEYEVCATRYQSTMSKIGQAAAATTTSTTSAAFQYHIGTTMATHPAYSSDSNRNAGGGYYPGDAGQQQQQHHHHHRNHHNNNNNSNSTKHAEDAEEERLKTVCCAFQRYMQCSEFTVRQACGDQTALFTRRFLDKMSDTLMRMHCVDYTPESGKCRDYFSSSARAVMDGGGRLVSLVSNVLVVLVLLLLRLQSSTFI